MAFRSADDGCAQISHQCAALGRLQVLLSGKVWLQEHKQRQSCPALVCSERCGLCGLYDRLQEPQEPSWELCSSL